MMDLSDLPILVFPNCELTFSEQVEEAFVIRASCGLLTQFSGSHLNAGNLLELQGVLHLECSWQEREEDPHAETDSSRF